MEFFVVDDGDCVDSTVVLVVSSSCSGNNYGPIIL
jgi:hypothetical protein